MKAKITEENIKDTCRKDGYKFNKSFYKIRNNRARCRYIEVTHNLCGKTYEVRVYKFMVYNQRCSCLRRNHAKHTDKGDDK